MRVEIIAEGFRARRGRACFGLFTSPQGFPDYGKRAFERADARIEDGQAYVCFDDLPDRPFAVSVLHDQDGDRRMRTGAFGIPREGFGVSRNPRIRFGPPRFGECAIPPAQELEVFIATRYLSGRGRGPLAVPF